MLVKGDPGDNGNPFVYIRDITFGIRTWVVRHVIDRKGTPA